MIPLVPLVTGDQVAFWVFGPIAVVCGVLMVLMRKPVHSAISLAGVMVSLAALYAAQDAPLLFVLQIIVYTGAVLMLFLFVVMLVGVDTRDSVVETLKGHRIASALAAGGVAVLLLTTIGRGVFPEAPTGLEAANSAYGGNVEGLAAMMFSRYVFPFEATAALLITAAVGAMVLAHGERFRPKKTQFESARERVAAYGRDGTHPGPLPSSGVFANNNAISVPALLPDGSVAESSVSQTLAARGAIIAVDDLRARAGGAFGAIEESQDRAKGVAK